MENQQKMKTSGRFVDVITAVLLAVLVALMAALCWLVDVPQNVSYLASSFLQGKLYFVDTLPSLHDTIFYNGVYFWHQGPLPAVFLMPFVAVAQAVGQFFYQGYLQIGLVLLTLILIFLSTKRLGFSKRDAMSLTLGFFGSSAYLGVAIWPQYSQFAHVVTVVLYAALVYEYLTKRRYAVMGFLLGLLYLTRATAALAVLFFIIVCLKTSPAKRKDLTKLLVPLLAAIIVLALYNYGRFRDPFELGYSHPGYTDESLGSQLAAARSYGMFGLAHLPGNLYYAFLSGPLPVFKDGVPPVLAFPYVTANPWGMSIFLTSPYLLLLFWGNYKKWEPQALLITSTVIALPLFLYYGVGFYQFGYRYSLDFFPLLFLLFARIVYDRYRTVPIPLKVLTLFSVVFNAFLFFTIFR